MPNSYSSSPLMVATMPQYHQHHHSHHGPGDHNFAAAATTTASPRLLPLNTGSVTPATPSTVGSASPVAFPRRHLSSFSQSDTQTSPLIPGSPMPRMMSIPSWRSPYLASRPLSVSSAANVNKSSTQRFSTSSSLMEDVLLPGDVVGEGRDFAGSELRALGGQGPSDVAPELEVIRKLGSGSYAVVYLVREVLSRVGGPGSSDDHATGRMDDYDAPSNRSSEEVVYGREFALKCLSKMNLVDDEALAAQMTEVTIHQSLPDHDNIVTLHRTFETAAYLLLLLEYVPGEDLFYFLEQARDHMDDSYSYTDSDALGLVRTPPTPSLLSNLAPHQLLSRTRLRLVASMFGQMCEAVANCHEVGVYHRDIKPENFIVTDGRTTLQDGRSERKVVVKLSDFGLSTMDEDSADMDCGSAPYMSYECRNNIAPTYKPRAADVWSLGIVLINMLYHINPWSDAADGACSSFSSYRAQPVPFFMARFPGMTGPVAEYLTSRIFNILDDHLDDSARATAAEFGAWARNLPDLLGPPPVPVGLGLAMHGHHQRVLSTSSAKGHPLAMASAAPSSRPASRAASRHGSRVNSIRTPAMRARSLSRGAAGMESPILGHALAHAEPELSTIIDESQELEEAATNIANAEAVNLNDQDVDDSESRSQSTTKRRKRGARKGKGAAQPTGMAVEARVLDDTLNTLASASQSLARELSRQKQLPHPGDMEYGLGMQTSQTQTENIVPPSPVVTPQQAPPTTLLKKASKWKLSFGKSSSERMTAATANALVNATTAPPVPDVPQHLQPANLATEQLPQRFKSATANNVQSLIMGLSPSASAADNANFNVNRPPVPRVIPGPNRGRTVPAFQGVLPPQHGVQIPVPAPVTSTVNVNSPYSINNTVPAARRQTSPSANSVRSAYSGHSGRVGGGTVPGSAASSVYAYSARSINVSGNNGNSAGNWRSSTSSAATSTSAFTRYSNGSRQSVSTMATSVSGESWRSGGSKPGSMSSVGSVGSLAVPPSVAPSNASKRTHVDGVPVNVKIMHGIPWELDQLPRGQYPKPEGDIFGQPPPPRNRKPRSKHGNSALGLGSIDEAGPALMTVPVQRSDAATSTTDLSHLDADDEVQGEGPKKVQKGQINALAKMLSALRR